MREVYERAVANVPPAPAKRYWQRYIYLWLNYALWEELEAGDAGRAREVYRACLKVIPHVAFTFAKARASAPCGLHAVPAVLACGARQLQLQPGQGVGGAEPTPRRAPALAGRAALRSCQACKGRLRPGTRPARNHREAW